MTEQAEYQTPKLLVWLGRSKRDLLAPPASVVDTFGYALFLAQIGKRHDSTKVLRGFGDACVVGVIESLEGNAYRAVYTVRFSAAVFVLHVFQKKSKSGVETPRPDMTRIAERLKLAARLAKDM